ncbi:glycosyltransferase [Parasitella parasitica]|nr:glycosyltransferase [Parasitella parasitica]
MQEVEGFIMGERDYTKLKGDTGPLVYPAGFVYIYSLLYYLTDHGKDVRLAQYIFEFLYLLSQLVVCAIYRQSKKVPPYIILLLGCSKRLHSIFLLRCFNDPVAMLFMFACLLAMLYRKWTLSSLLYSLALSIKMNVLLFFPAFGIILWQVLGAYKTLGQLGLIALTQLAIAYPFLNQHPVSYFSKAFEFRRVFDYQWTVNWRMMTEETFVSNWFAKELLIGHGFTLLMFIIFIWCGPYEYIDMCN